MATAAGVYTVFAILATGYGGALPPGSPGYVQGGHKIYSAEVPAYQTTENLALFDFQNTDCYDVKNLRAFVNGKEVSVPMEKIKNGYVVPAWDGMTGKIRIEFDLIDRCKAAIDKAIRAQSQHDEQRQQK